MQEAPKGRRSARQKGKQAWAAHPLHDQVVRRRAFPGRARCEDGARVGVPIELLGKGVVQHQVAIAAQYQHGYAICRGERRTLRVHNASLKQCISDDGESQSLIVNGVLQMRPMRPGMPSCDALL